MILLAFTVVLLSGTVTLAHNSDCSWEVTSAWRRECELYIQQAFAVPFLSVVQQAYLHGNVSGVVMQQQIHGAVDQACHWINESVECEKRLVQRCYANDFSSVFEIWMRMAVVRACDSANVERNLIGDFLNCNAKEDFVGSFQRQLNHIISMTANPSPTGLEPADNICLALRRLDSLYGEDEIISLCGHREKNSTAGFLRSVEDAFACENGTSDIYTVMNPILPLPALPSTTPNPWTTNGTFSPWQTTTPYWWQPQTTTNPPGGRTTTPYWWLQTTTSPPGGRTTTPYWWLQTTTSPPGGRTTTPYWWQVQTTTNAPWGWTTTDDDWWRPTTPAPVIDIPEYLLKPFNATCRKGQMHFSENDPDLVDAVSLVFDGDNTLNCRLILNDLHHWILAQMGETRQKRSFDEEPIKVTCTRGNLTVSSADPGTSESTDLVFQTGASTRCITVFREFLTYITGSFKSYLI